MIERDLFLAREHQEALRAAADAAHVHAPDGSHLAHDGVVERARRSIGQQLIALGGALAGAQAGADAAMATAGSVSGQNDYADASCEDCPPASAAA